MQFDSIQALEEYLETERVLRHKIAVVDIDGVLRGKYLSRGKLRSAIAQGLGFCDVVLGWDSNDDLYDNTRLSGWHTGYRDAPVRLDLSTVRRLPTEPDTVLLLGSFADSYKSACPRSLLRRVTERAEALGFRPRAAFEYEFFVFDETPHSAREKGYRNLRPFTPGNFGYSLLRSGVHSELFHELLDQMKAFEVPIEGLHTETGPGVLEAALEHDWVGEAADRAALFKTFTKVLLGRRNLMATFMAKWSNEVPGQSGHLHLSLEDDTGNNVFFDAAAPDGLSKLCRHFVAGQVALLPELLPMVCSTVNSYRRLVPGLWAPTHSNWGIENRTTSVRAIPAGPSGTRSEYRIGPADGNPYLVAAAALGAGLWGIEQQLDIEPITGNAYEHPGAKSQQLASNLLDATRAFEDSLAAKELFGETFVEHFAATRHWEYRAVQQQVTNVDLERYFEII